MPLNRLTEDEMWEKFDQEYPELGTIYTNNKPHQILNIYI